MPEHLQELFRAIAVWHISGRHDYDEEEAKGIHEDMPLAAFHLLAGIIATEPPFSVVLTD